jgi:hypothetical protein
MDAAPKQVPGQGIIIAALLLGIACFGAFHLGVALHEKRENVRHTRLCQSWGFDGAASQLPGQYDCVISGVDDRNRPHDYVVDFSRAQDYELEARNVRTRTEQFLERYK